ncbi:conserved hypothetical protein [Ixodes scapularis]|uniref:Uncharacterized protein n=1 Tax=Ixodes scapularis TaxID=6945 RepID=B7PYF4_IXOSC|nr:conserved hypothetical protein [Ixodes scapularis]|eukprot:XP_002403050.1 conserved hypothetical protein [Ixodes scapularis]
MAPPPTANSRARTPLVPGSDGMGSQRRHALWLTASTPVLLLLLLLLPMVPESLAKGARNSAAMDTALRQINLSLLYTLACDTTVSSEVQVKRFQCLLRSIDPSDKMVVLGCQYNVGGTMDAAAFLTALCENKLNCNKVKNMQPVAGPVPQLPEPEQPIQAGVSGPEQGGAHVTSSPGPTTQPAAPTTTPGPAPPASEAPREDTPPAAGGEGKHRFGWENVPAGGGDSEDPREDNPRPGDAVAATSSPPPASTAAVPADPPGSEVPDDILPPPPADEGGDEMSFYPCLCARKAKFRGRWKQRHNSRRRARAAPATSWKDYNFLFPLGAVRAML